MKVIQTVVNLETLQTYLEEGYVFVTLIPIIGGSPMFIVEREIKESKAIVPIKVGDKICIEFIDAMDNWPPPVVGIVTRIWEGEPVIQVNHFDILLATESYTSKCHKLS
jgi:hypothetical protein